MHSVMEAIYFGVKMVAIPIFFDQRNVASRLEQKGVARVLSKNANSAEIFDAINTVIYNSR